MGRSQLRYIVGKGIASTLTVCGGIAGPLGGAVASAMTFWTRPEEPPSWSGRSLEERAKAIESACRTAMQLFEGSPDRIARLGRVDPVPASTELLIRRLAGADA